MIDHVFRFDTQAEAEAALPDYWTGTQWRAPFGQAVLRVEAVTSEAIVDVEAVLTPEVCEAGVWLAIAAPQQEPALIANDACQFTLDRARAAKGLGAVLVARLTLAEINAFRRLKPVWAGSGYNWGTLTPVPGAELPG